MNSFIFMHILFQFIDYSCNHTFGFLELSSLSLMYSVSLCGQWLCGYHFSLFFHISYVSALRLMDLLPQSLIVRFYYQWSAIEFFSVFRKNSIVEGLCCRFFISGLGIAPQMDFCLHIHISRPGPMQKDM